MAGRSRGSAAVNPVLGPVPTAEEALARYTDELRTAQHR
ncbi:hypothetical protein a10_01652 [Streptomyces acidiscabies]|nr:hypothetical protein a10_01652 [Streptomyces acidiscabies]GAV37647.1 hypothetical protein Saa2_00521 [Streptomyces acidiscabies]